MLPEEDEADAWLAPVALDEHAIVNEHPATESSTDVAECTAVCNPIGAARISNKGFLRTSNFNNWLASRLTDAQLHCMSDVFVLPPSEESLGSS